MRASGITSQGLEFQKFLYAPIGDDPEGMTLSVLSALARQDVDPWAEASRLAHLPEEAAATQILNLLDALPSRTLGGLDRAELAGRLSALLPRGALNLASILRPHSTTGASSAAVVWCFLCAYFSLMLLMNWLLTEFHVPPVAAASDSAPGVVENAPDTRPMSDRPGAD
jgi:hypothetical protein